MTARAPAFFERYDDATNVALEQYEYWRRDGLSNAMILRALFGRAPLSVDPYLARPDQVITAIAQVWLRCLDAALPPGVSVS